MLITWLDSFVFRNCLLGVRNFEKAALKVCLFPEAGEEEGQGL